MIKLSIIIPCYNSGHHIVQNINKLKKKIRKFNIFSEIILVDDGSKDNTLKQLIIAKKKFKNIKILKNKKNIGKSFSLIKGIKKSKFKQLLIYDSDLPYFNDLNKILKNLKKYDLIFIDRKSKNSKLKSKKLSLYQISRLIVGKLVCFIINLINLSNSNQDTQAGLKAFNKPRNFNKIKFVSKKFFFDAEIMILFHINNKKILSIPVTYEVPKESTIKIFSVKNFIYIFELLKVLLKYNLFKKINHESKF